MKPQSPIPTVLGRTILVQAADTTMRPRRQSSWHARLAGFIMGMAAGVLGTLAMIEVMR